MKLCSFLAILACASSARADRSIAIDAIDTPFSANELRAAVRVRLAPEGEPVRLRVRRTADGVRIENGGDARVVDVTGYHGIAAARLVALAAADLLMNDLAAAPEGDSPGPPGSTTTLAMVAPTVSVQRARPEVVIAGLGGAQAWSAPLGGASVDVAVRRGRGVLAVDAGIARLSGGGLALDAYPVRLALGVRNGALELRAGAVMVPIVVATELGDRTVLLGGTGSLRARVPITHSMAAVAAGGLDVLASRTTYRLMGMTVLSTPTFAPWIALGIEVTP